MGFIDSYKRLEKICGEILKDERRLSAYIDEMMKIPNGSFYVKGWDDDLRQLKHYRWIRNHIAHEPGCTEENMCKPSYALWLDNFYFRIIKYTDPLALYFKATQQQKAQKAKQGYKAAPKTYTYSRRLVKQTEASLNAADFIAVFISSLIIVAVIFLVSKII